MKTGTVQLVSGRHHMDCEIHVDGVFPEYYAVQLISGGSMYFQRGAHARQEFSTPAFFWTDRDSHYHYGPGSTGSWQHNWIVFQGPWADRFYRPLLESLAPHGIVPIHELAQLHQEFEASTEEIRYPDYGFRQVHALNRLLSLVERGAQKPGTPENPVHRIKSLIDNHPERTFDFPKLARQAGISYSSFRRTFRQRFERAPLQYQVSHRMQVAAAHLAHSTMSVQTIGEQVGYEDPADFSRTFRKHFGLAPLHFRQRAAFR